MSAAAATASSRFLPRGWLDLLRQVLIWVGFALAYQVVRGIADRSPAAAFANARDVIDFERRTTGLWELSLQSLAHSSELLTMLTTWTYWLSQFPVLALALLWVYLRRHDAFARLRNCILLANVLGLAGYVLLPTAPPRMFPELDFVDTLATFGGMTHESGLVQLASNPYAAMPSLHSADALLIGVGLALIVRSLVLKLVWLAWPVWVWFSVMATGNHFWLDIVAGIAVALVGAAVVYRRALARQIGRTSHA